VCLDRDPLEPVRPKLRQLDNAQPPSRAACFIALQIERRDKRQACNVHDVHVTDPYGSCLRNVEQVSILSLDGVRLSALLRAASAATVAPLSL
jgi:hypothetical protein